jgi:hypothetical protein
MGAHNEERKLLTTFLPMDIFHSLWVKRAWIKRRKKQCLIEEFVEYIYLCIKMWNKFKFESRTCLSNTWIQIQDKSTSRGSFPNGKIVAIETLFSLPELNNSPFGKETSLSHVHVPSGIWDWQNTSILVDDGLNQILKQLSKILPNF